ncbi:hypothetical protein ACLOJK_029891 [Asimina triloba]
MPYRPREPQDLMGNIQCTTPAKALQQAELNYSPLEKLVFALITVRRKLRPYFQSCPIQVLTNYPLRRKLRPYFQSYPIQVLTNYPLREYKIKDETIARYLVQGNDPVGPASREKP